MPGRKNGKWGFVQTSGRHIEKDKFEDFKSRFYTLQGWETSTGYPTQKTLTSLGLEHVADELQKAGKLGKA